MESKIKIEHKSTIKIGRGFIGFDSFTTNPKGTSCVGIYDDTGKRIAYWDSEEWREDPQGVMGAIMGALCALTKLPVDNATAEKLKKYNVTIKATVTKTYEVEADTEDQAIEEAHGIFSVLNDDAQEDYEEDTLSVEEVASS